jgi:hypothetical protein
MLVQHNDGIWSDHRTPFLFFIIYFIDSRATLSAIAIRSALGFKDPVTPGTFCLIHNSFFLYSYNFTAKRSDAQVAWVYPDKVLGWSLHCGRNN